MFSKGYVESKINKALEGVEALRSIANSLNRIAAIKEADFKLKYGVENVDEEKEEAN